MLHVLKRELLRSGAERSGAHLPQTSVGWLHRRSAGGAHEQDNYTTCSLLEAPPACSLLQPPPAASSRLRRRRPRRPRGSKLPRVRADSRVDVTAACIF